jgi:hypothetical protein
VRDRQRGVSLMPVGARYAYIEHLLLRICANGGGASVGADHELIRSPIELGTNGAILLRQDGRASWASRSEHVRVERLTVRDRKVLGARQGSARWVADPTRRSHPQSFADLRDALRWLSEGAAERV